jgi:methionyl-tRNA synthetase
MYVWIDALANYLTIAGWTRSTQGNWPCDLHTIGKDIVKFHGIYWPAFLIAAGIVPYKRLLVHGWWTIDRRKMGKSGGNALDPFVLRDKWGIEALKYVLLREVTLANDSEISDECILNRYNHELGDIFGNLVLRLLSKSLIPQLVIPQPAKLNEVDLKIIEYVETLPGTVDHYIQFGQTRRTLEVIWEILRDLNKYISDQMPWKQANDNPERARTIIYVAYEV